MSSVQKGVKASAGSATITAVDITKAFIISTSKGSAGTAAVNSTISGSIRTYSKSYAFSNTGCSYTQNPPITGALSGGTTDLTTKQYSAVLTNATTVTCDGPCEWQVIAN